MTFSFSFDDAPDAADDMPLAEFSFSPPFSAARFSRHMLPLTPCRWLSPVFARPAFAFRRPFSSLFLRYAITDYYFHFRRWFFATLMPAFS
jgi:hypothetical protein